MFSEQLPCILYKPFHIEHNFGKQGCGLDVVSVQGISLLIYLFTYVYWDVMTYSLLVSGI